MRVTAAIAAVAAAACLLVGVDAQQRSRPKPVSFAILEDYDKGTDLREVEADFDLFATLEIDTWRGSIGWDDYEPARGRSDFAWLHEFADLPRRRRINLRPYIGHTPEWAARMGGADGDAWNNPPATLATWTAFAGSLAAALSRHENVLSYEIYNEENVAQWWDGDADSYARVLAAGAQAIRARRPAMPILFGGLVFPDASWIERVCSVAGAGRAFSVLPFHAYPETWTPADVTVENYLGGLDGFVAAADRTCGRKPIWINETGFATVPGRSERDQAAWWVRAIATFLAHPRVEHIGIYEIKDLAADRPAIGDTPNYHLGLVYADRRKKLAFYTVDLLTDLLDTDTLTVADDEIAAGDAEDRATGGTVHRHLFTRPDGDKVLIVWSQDDAATVSIRVPGVRASVEYGLDGRPLDWDPQAQALARLQLEKGTPRIFRLMP